MNIFMYVETKRLISKNKMNLFIYFFYKFAFSSSLWNKAINDITDINEIIKVRNSCLIKTN